MRWIQLHCIGQGRKKEFDKKRNFQNKMVVAPKFSLFTWEFELVKPYSNVLNSVFSLTLSSAGKGTIPERYFLKQLI